MRRAVSFDDVLLLPKFNSIQSRNLVSTETTVCGVTLKIPVISANMPSVTGRAMGLAIGEAGGLGIVHRMQSIKDQAEEVYTVAQHNLPVGAAVGVGQDTLQRSEALIAAGATVLCLDVAHGDQESVHNVATSLLSTFPNAGLIVGNYATGHALERLLHAIPHKSLYFSDGRKRVACKLSVGSGALCTTRITTGFGVPTLQAVLDAQEVVQDFCDIIADGGIKNSGDICKSLAAGAEAVMLGSLLAGTAETPGQIISIDGNKFKVYRGAASYGAKSDFFGKAEYIEGAESIVPYKGSVTAVLQTIMEGVRSGFTYCGAENLREFQARAEFIEITSAGHQESKPHLLTGRNT